jgi:hypothetical protein
VTCEHSFRKPWQSANLMKRSAEPRHAPLALREQHAERREGDRPVVAHKDGDELQVADAKSMVLQSEVAASSEGKVLEQRGPAAEEPGVAGGGEEAERAESLATCGDQRQPKANED